MALVIQGDRERTLFVSKHELSCTSHFVLLFDQKQKCVCGKSITSDYFTFAYRKQGTGDDFEIFHAGPGCGRKFIELAELPVPPLTDPLSGDFASGTSNVTRQKGTPGQRNEELSRVNREMLQAASLLFALWGGPQPGFIQNGLIEIMRNPSKDIAPQFIKALNKAVRSTLISSQARGRNPNLSLRENFAGIAEQNGRHARPLNFERLKVALKNKYPDEIFSL